MPPTQGARDNLLREGKRPETIVVTGNTAIDALKTTVREDYSDEILEWAKGSRLVVLTAHRRENLGAPMHRMFRAIRRVVEEFPDVKVVYPVHLNPLVQKAAEEELGGCDRVKLIDPLEVIEFHNLLARSTLILTDSGGIQEEAPSLGKPVIVLRDTTERPEGIAAGTLKLARHRRGDHLLSGEGAAHRSGRVCPDEPGQQSLWGRAGQPAHCRRHYRLETGPGVKRAV